MTITTAMMDVDYMPPREDTGDNNKLWSESEDTFLFTNFLSMTDNVLETKLNRSKADIRQRREHFGLIRPKIIRRTGSKLRIQKIVFHLKKGQTISGKVKVAGGKNDVVFGFFWYEGTVSSLRPNNQEKIVDTKNYNYQISATGKHCFYFSNSFSLITSKTVEFIYRLGSGKDVSITFKI